MLQTGDDLVIQIFFWTSGFLCGVEAMKAAKWRLWTFTAVGVALVIVGLFWGLLKEISPAITRWVTDVATSPQSWFVLIVLSLLLLSITGRKHGTGNTELDNTDLTAEMAALKKSVTEFGASLAKLTKTQHGGTGSIAEVLSNMQRTAFLLSTAYVQAEYQRRIEGQLEAVPFDTAITGTVVTDEHLIAQAARIESYLNGVRQELYGSHWLEELSRIEREAEYSADAELRKTGSPERVNPYAYREFHIACMKRDYIADFLNRALNEARSQNRQMLQMVRERPELHKGR